MNENKDPIRAVCGIPIQSTNLDQIISQVANDSDGCDVSSGFSYCFLNSNSIVEADRIPEYMFLLSGNKNNYPDGTPVYVLAKIKSFGRNPEMKKTPGPDVFECFLLSKKTEIRQYFIGSEDSTLQAIAERLEIPYDSDLFFSPAYTSDIEALQNQISSFLANKPSGLVWLGLGGTKQDLVALKLAKKMPFCFVGVGAGFDFFAGTQKRSPKLMNQLGVEWIFRLSREPKRLASRYLKGNFLFLFIVLKRDLLKVTHRRKQPK